MFGNLLAGGISGILKGAKGIIEEFHLDPAEKLRLQMELMKVEHEVDRAQISVNAQEAKHPNWFVSGWRPFVGWTCGIGLGYQVLLQPLLTWLSGIAQIASPPPIEVGVLIPVLMGMLGLGGIRAFEKMKGVSRG